MSAVDALKQALFAGGIRAIERAAQDVARKRSHLDNNPKGVTNELSWRQWRSELDVLEGERIGLLRAAQILRELPNA